MPQDYEQRKSFVEMSVEEITGITNKWFDRVISSRRHVERDALLNIAFLLDQQYYTTSKVGDSVRLIPEPPKKGKVQTVEQIIEPIVRTEMARLLRTQPKGQVIPQGQDAPDVEAARAAEDVLEHVHRTHFTEEYQEDAVLWMLAGGTAIENVYWDDDKVDEFGNQGDFVFRALSPFEFGVPQIRNRRISEQPYVMVTKAFELDDVEDRWGVRVEPDRSTKFGSLDNRLTSIVSSGSSNRKSSGSTESKVPMTVVKETWIKPGPLNPEGVVVVTASDKILDIQPWPEWCKGDYPFAKLDYIPIPGAFWSKALVTALVPIQRRHNRAASIIVETMNVMARLTLAAPRNTHVRSALGGKAVLFETPLGSMGSVTNVQPPQIGDLPFQELNNTRMASRDIAHQHEVTKGYTPPNVRSGTAINALKEHDDSASTIPVRSIERAAQKTGRIILNIVQEKWDEARLVYVLGEDGAIERHSFVSGTDVSGQYVVIPGTAWPYSKAEKQQMIFEAIDRQMIAPEEGLKFLDVGTLGGVLRERNKDIRHARRENQKFKAMDPVNPATGQPDMEWIHAQFMSMLPADWHNHETHIHVHNEERKSPEFEKWDTWKQALFEAHIMGHQAVLQQMAQQQQAMEAGA